MRARIPLVVALSLGCSPSREAPPLVLPGALSTEGGIDIWWTAPGTAPGEEQDTELDDELVNLIDAATTTLDLALYEFDLANVVEAVEDAWDRGVDVRMVGDGDEVHDAGYLALEAAGIPIVNRPAGNRIMHHKFVVADEQAVWTGSTNISHNGLNRNDNHALIVRSSAMAAGFTYEFEEMYGGEFGRGKTALAGTRSIALADGSLDWHFAPTHDPIDVVVDAIDNADHTVAFMVFSFTHSDVVDALSRAQARGVSVLGIFDESQANGAWSVDETLAQAGVPVLIDGNGNASGFSGGKLHHKVLVVDAGTANASVVSGSMNWSAAGTGDNDENLLFIESPSLATPMMASFCELVDVATVHPDFSGTVPNLCDTDGATARPYADLLLINEVQGSDWRERFVELVSLTQDSLDLTGWRIEDDSGRTLHVFEEGKLPGGDATLLVGHRWSGRERNVVRASGPLRMALTGALVLVAPDGDEVDVFELSNTARGESLNRTLDGDPSSTPAAHSVLTARGAVASPGRRVDGRPWTMAPSRQALVINELLPDPDGTDLGEEYVELVNAGTTALDPTGFTLCDASGTCHTFGPPVLLPGEAMVLFDRGEHTDVNGARPSESGRLSLNNSGDVLTLTDSEGAEHDRVEWTASSAGHAWNRTVEADSDATLVRHNSVDGATGDQSPGTRVDGTPWN